MSKLPDQRSHKSIHEFCVRWWGLLLAAAIVLVGLTILWAHGALTPDSSALFETQADTVPADGSYPDLEELIVVRREVIAALNDIREGLGLSTVTESGRLDEAAQVAAYEYMRGATAPDAEAGSEWMRPDSTSLLQIVTYSRVTFPAVEQSLLAEVLHAASAQDALQEAWSSWEAECAKTNATDDLASTLLEASYTTAGIGCVRSPDDDTWYTILWLSTSADIVSVDTPQPR